MALVLGLARKLRCGSLELHLPDGTEQLFHGPQPGPRGVMRLRSGRVARRYLTGGSLGFAESFIDGDWDTPDLATLLALLSLNEEAWGDGYFGSLWHRGLRRMQHRCGRTPAAAAAATSTRTTTSATSSSPPGSIRP